jgi:putative peptidoglycan lipid II flippase
VSGILQFAMMMFFTRKYKILFTWQKPALSEKIKALFKNMGPGVLSAGIFQINLFVDMMVASLLPTGSISFLYYADRLNQLPLSIAGIAVGTALLPMLSRALAANNKEEGRDLFNRSLEFCFFVSLPAAVALLIIPLPMVSTLFQHGNFSTSDAIQTSYALMGYGIGLPAYIASKIFMTAFWAHQDTKTPVKISAIVALSNVALCLLLIGILGVAGISLATGLVGWMQVYMLHKQLSRHDALDFDDRLRVVFPKIAICSCIMGLVLSILTYEMHPYFQQALPVKILALVALMGGGVITYALTIQVSGVLKFKDIKLYLKRSKD